MIVVSAGFVMLAAWLLPSASARTDVAEGRAPITLRAVRKVAGSGNFLLFIAAAGTVQASHALFYGFGVLHWQSLGISTELISILWSISIVAEVALFVYAGWLVRLLGPLGLILAGGIAAVVRWGSMALDPPIVALFVLQTLHALTFAATHLGSMHFIQQAVPREQAGTAQAIYAAVTGGLITAGAMLLSGAIYGPYAGLSYLAMMALASIGVMAGLILRRRWMA
jgi:PPP family 3-phenylpropionic acid transporter